MYYVIPDKYFLTLEENRIVSFNDTFVLIAV